MSALLCPLAPKRLGAAQPAQQSEAVRSIFRVEWKGCEDWWVGRLTVVTRKVSSGGEAGLR